MRIRKSNLGSQKTVSNRTFPKRLATAQTKKINYSHSDGFSTLANWINYRGSWSFTGSAATAQQASSNYSMALAADIDIPDISAQVSLNTSGAGIAFWVASTNDWHAAIPYYTTAAETYIASYRSCNCQECCWGYYCRPAPQTGCHSTCGSCGCQSCPNYATGTRYRFYVRLLKSVGGTVSVIQDVEVRTTLNDSNDNLDRLRVRTLGSNVIVEAGSPDGNFYGSLINRNETTANRGPSCGIIYAPGGSSESNVLNSFVASEYNG